MSLLTTGRRSPTYEMNSEDPSAVAAFDTDYTMLYADGPVPLSHVTALRDDPDVAVYATGFNQTLRERADIPGMVEITSWVDQDTPDFVERADRMRLLDELHPDAERKFVVDDVDLRQLEAEGWAYYQPAEYVVEEMGVMPNDWPEVLGINAYDYLSRVGSFPKQFPGSEVQLDESMPYTARTETGVRTPVSRRESEWRGTVHRRDVDEMDRADRRTLREAFDDMLGGDGRGGRDE